MSTDMLIVDGYNVVHALPRYKNLISKGMEVAAGKLEHDLVNFASSADMETVLVFDGRGSGSQKTIGPLLVIYSGKGQSADEVIEKKVFSQGGEKEIIVCTSDYAQQKVVWRSGVSRMSPKEFGERLSAGELELDESKEPRRRSTVEDRLPRDIRQKMDRLRRVPKDE